MNTCSLIFGDVYKKVVNDHPVYGIMLRNRPSTIHTLEVERDYMCLHSYINNPGMQKVTDEEIIFDVYSRLGKATLWTQDVLDLIPFFVNQIKMKKNSPFYS